MFIVLFNIPCTEKLPFFFLPNIMFVRSFTSQLISKSFDINSYVTFQNIRKIRIHGTGWPLHYVKNCVTHANPAHPRSPLQVSTGFRGKLLYLYLATPAHSKRIWAVVSSTSIRVLHSGLSVMVIIIWANYWLYDKAPAYCQPISYHHHASCHHRAQGTLKVAFKEL